ncbi:hypothetical protein FKB34_04550 [Glycocaulis profundi]|nr:hypothetical protein FKB34_04550 [Glycocaulis profundi]
MPALALMIALALQTAPPVDLDAEVAAIRAGEVDVLDYDWGRLRFHPDRQAAWAAMADISRFALENSELPSGIRESREPFSTCLAGDRAAAIMFGIRGAKLSPDVEAYDRALAAARAVRADVEAELDEALAEIETEESDPLIAELRALHARDQAWRHALGRFTDVADDQSLDGLGGYGLNVLMGQTAPPGCRVDLDSTAFLKRVTGEIGWFTISDYGEEADEMAWLLAQHTPESAFMAEILDRLTVLARSGETNPRHYAYLHDRVAIRDGRPQRYGTQFSCIGGRLVPREIEDRDEVDARRAELGMEPLQTRRC